MLKSAIIVKRSAVHDLMCTYNRLELYNMCQNVANFLKVYERRKMHFVRLSSAVERSQLYWRVLESCLLNYFVSVLYDGESERRNKNQFLFPLLRYLLLYSFKYIISIYIVWLFSFSLSLVEFLLRKKSKATDVYSSIQFPLSLSIRSFFTHTECLCPGQNNANVDQYSVKWTSRMRLLFNEIESGAKGEEEEWSLETLCGFYVSFLWF